MHKPVLICLLVCGLLLIGCSDDDPASPPPRADVVPQEIIYDTGEVTDEFTKDELMAGVNDFTTADAGIDETQNIEMFSADWDVRFGNYHFVSFEVTLYVLDEPTTDRLRDWANGRYVGNGKLLTEVTSSHPQIVTTLDIDYDYTENALYVAYPGKDPQRVLLDDHGENLFLLCVGYLNLYDSASGLFVPYTTYQVNALKTIN
jgi:hypothetical protein